jgi:hypothetical protein
MRQTKEFVLLGEHLPPSWALAGSNIKVVQCGPNVYKMTVSFSSADQLSTKIKELGMAFDTTRTSWTQDSERTVRDVLKRYVKKSVMLDGSLRPVRVVKTSSNMTMMSVWDRVEVRLLEPTHRLASSGEAACGAFAVKPFVKDDVIGVYNPPGSATVYTASEANTMEATWEQSGTPCPAFDSTFLAGSVIVNPNKLASPLCFCNHSDRPNCMFTIVGSIVSGRPWLTVLLVATTDIQPGSELTVDYGKGYWGRGGPRKILKKKSESKSNSTKDTGRYYRVARFVGRRMQGRAISYKVRWHGYGAKDDSWVPRSLLVTDLGKASFNAFVRKFEQRAKEVAVLRFVSKRVTDRGDEYLVHWADGDKTWELASNLRADMPRAFVKFVKAM